MNETKKQLRTQDVVTRRLATSSDDCNGDDDAPWRETTTTCEIHLFVYLLRSPRKNRFHGARVTPTRAHSEQINLAPTRLRPSLCRRIPLAVSGNRPIADTGGLGFLGRDWQVTRVTPYCRLTHCSARPPMPSG